ncbi:MAG: LPS export ABC transporter periplasmic protein LptC [Duodenibacillus sp.]|nr:LPS export ABC transporter periplasmic protein LptC [Duodenibacillus sp.]
MRMNMRDKLTSLMGVGLLAVLAATSYYYSVKSDISSYRTETNPESPEFTAETIHRSEFSAGGSHFRSLSAKKALYYEDGRIVGVDPRLVLHAPGEPRTTLTAKALSSDDNGQSITFTGNVRVDRDPDAKNPKSTFETESATYFPDTSRLVTHKPAAITVGSDFIAGDLLSFDNVERTLEVRGNVRSRLTPKAKDDPQPPAENDKQTP